LDVIRAVIELDRPGWEQSMADAVRTIDAVGVRCQFEVVVPDDRRVFADLVDALKAAQIGDADVFLFSASGFVTTNALLDVFTAQLGRPHRLRFGGGSRAFFAEFNRTHVRWRRLDLIGFPIAAQVHAFDDTSVMETLDAYTDIVKSANTLAEGRPLVVGPITLMPRFNPYAPARESLGPSMDEHRIDARQETPFAAAWTLGVLARLTQTRPLTALLHEATGPAGLLADDPSASHRPVAALLRQLATTSGESQLLTATSSGVAAIAMIDDDGHVHVLVANLRSSSREVSIVVGADRINQNLPGHDVTHIVLPASTSLGRSPTQ
jgi:hypothetical protein